MAHVTVVHANRRAWLPREQVAKNVVLAGVGSVTLLDDTPCSEASPANFLIPADTDATQRCTSAGTSSAPALPALARVILRPSCTRDSAFCGEFLLVRRPSKPGKAVPASSPRHSRCGRRSGSERRGQRITTRLTVRCVLTAARRPPARRPCRR